MGLPGAFKPFLRSSRSRREPDLGEFPDSRGAFNGCGELVLGCRQRFFGFDEFPLRVLRQFASAARHPFRLFSATPGCLRLIVSHLPSSLGPRQPNARRLKLVEEPLRA